MSLTFPVASTVLVFNVGGGGIQAAKEPAPAPTAPTALPPATPPKSVAEPAPKPSAAGVEQPSQEIKDAHIADLLSAVDSEAYALAKIPSNWDELNGKEAPAPEGELIAPNCNTEKSVPVNVHKNPNPLALQVGNFGEVPRWKPGSVIKWGYFNSGWPGGITQGNQAAAMLNQAAEEWNKLNLGVSFGLATTLKECTFVLGYNAARTTLIAEAFFPNGNDLNYVNVYEQGVSGTWFPQLKAVFLHELGHALGLRHEFAMDPGSMYEGGSVQFGPRDPYSVMNYRNEPPRITTNDINSARGFYAVTEPYIGSMPIRDYIPY